MGSNAYGSSYGETAVGVVAAPQQTETPATNTATLPPFELYIAASTIAIIAAVAVIGLMLRKK
jgi:hypothetical protein